MTPKSKADLYLVVPWGAASTADIENAIGKANMAQDVFQFECNEPILLDENRYRLPNGFLDLDRAASDLSRTKAFKNLVFDKLVLVTAKPYSEPGIVAGDISDPLDEGYFLEEALPFDPKISIVSYWVWERLPRWARLPALKPDGRRSLVPYLIYSFGVIALHNDVELAFHDETRGCPLDYCYHVKDIDRFFSTGELCHVCDDYLQTECREERLQHSHLDAIKRLLNVAVGRSADFGYYTCFISYGQPDREFALKLHRALNKRGIRCWLYDMQATPGQRTWKEIKDKQKEADKVLVLCSEASLSRDGVRKEIEEQVDLEPDKIVPVSLDCKWQSPRFKVVRGRHDLKPFLIERNYADFTSLRFGKAFERLMSALKWR